MEKLIVTSSPHVHSGLRTDRIMLDVVIALAPISVMSVVLFGLKALFVLLTCTGAAVLSEFLFNLIIKKKQTVGDFSAVVTGLLLGLNIHSDVPLWQCAVGAVFSIVVVKCMFGGLGCNFANPAIAGRVFMLIAFSETGGGTMPTLVDVEASATPLALIGEEGAELPSIGQMLLGLRGGAIGETCAVALLVGFVYLLVRRVIRWHIPTVFIGTVFVITWIAYGSISTALIEVLAGGLLLGAIYMATDYVTSPINTWGRVVYAFGCGLMTSLIRIFGAFPEGVSFAILFMNILTPYIEKWTAPKPLGAAKPAKEAQK